MEHMDEEKSSLFLSYPQLYMLVVWLLFVKTWPASRAFHSSSSSF